MSSRADRPTDGVVIHQPPRAFRYGSEAFWLAGLALTENRPHTALDLGTGSGIIAWLLASRGVAVTGVDIATEWQPFWERSIAESRVSGKVALEVGSVATWRPSDPVDVVVSNPPFFPAGSGPVPNDPWKARARFEQDAPLSAFLELGSEAVRPGGHVHVVLPSDRLGDAKDAAPKTLGLAAVRRVGARRVIVSWVRGEPVFRGEVSLLDRGPEVLSWYAAVGAEPPPSRDRSD